MPGTRATIRTSVTGDGVSCPTGGDGRRSTTGTGRAIFADSVRAVAPELAARIEHTSDWRKGYIRPLRDIVAAAAATPESAVQISRDGLASAHRRFTFERDGQARLLGEAMATFTTPGYGAVNVRGLMPREGALSVPYRGRRLFGDAHGRAGFQFHFKVLAEHGKAFFQRAQDLLAPTALNLLLHLLDVQLPGGGDLVARQVALGLNEVRGGGNSGCFFHRQDLLPSLEF